MRNPRNRLGDGGAPHRCGQCRLLHADCLCALVPRLTTRSRVVLVLHTLEDQKTSNTGRLAIRCLTNSAVVLRGVEGEPMASIQPSPGFEAVVLFPGPGARPVSDWAHSPRPIELFVPDGTWGQAQRARQRVVGLGDLPCAMIARAAPSDYRLRLARDPRRLATIESIAEALDILEARPREGEPEVRAELLRIFNVMVERSLKHRARERAVPART